MTAWADKTGPLGKLSAVKMNYVLIDYENVQPESMAVPDTEAIHVTFFLGPHQNKIPVQLAKAMQILGKRGQWFQVAAAGKNALDFHIAFHIGEIAAKDTEAYIHVISKDTGFDPLLRYLKKERGIAANRYETLDAVPVLKPNGTTVLKDTVLKDRVAAVVAHFQQPKTTKPRTRTTLSNQISNLFQKSLSEAEREGLIAELLRRGFVVLDGAKVEHHWPPLSGTTGTPNG